MSGLLFLCSWLIVVCCFLSPAQASIAYISHLDDVEVLHHGTFDVDFIYLDADTFDSSILMPDFDIAYVSWAADAVRDRLDLLSPDNTLVGPSADLTAGNFMVPIEGLWDELGLPENNRYARKYVQYDATYGWLLESGERTSSVIPGGIYADFTPSNVPVPAAVWLLGSGLIGIFGIKRKFKN